jgi:RimJ/RimL family protein N-acetyltransferase
MIRRDLPVRARPSEEHIDGVRPVRLADRGDARLMPEPVMADAAIELDAYSDDDAQAQLAGEDEEHARRFGWYPDRSTVESVAEAIAEWRDDERLRRPRRAFAIRTAGDRVLVGGCEIRIDPDRVGEVSYWVFPAYRGRGLASRALRLLVPWATDNLGVERFRLEIEHDNVASIRVATHAGFVPVGERLDDAGRMMLLFERSKPLDP